MNDCLNAYGHHDECTRTVRMYARHFEEAYGQSPGSGSVHSHVRGRAYEGLAPELELVDGHRFVVASSAPHPTPCACSGGRTSPLAMQRSPSFAKSASTASCEAASTAASLATAPQRPLPQLQRPLPLPPLLALPPLREEASVVVLDEPPGSSVLVGKGRSQPPPPSALELS
jgi:hypothetical protein